MESITWDQVTRTVAAIGGAIAGMYGGWNGTLTVLVVFMVADYFLGCVCALTGNSPKTNGGRFLSSVAFMGLLKKAVIMLVVLLAVQLDKAIGGNTCMFQGAATFFYIANEGLSIIENCGLLGVPIPGALRDALEALRDKGDKGDSTGTGTSMP